MNRLLALFKKEFTVLGRDKHGLLVLFVMPAVFILIMSLALRDTVSEQRGVTIDFLVLDQAGVPISHNLLERLEGLEGFRPQAAVESDREWLEAAVAADRFKFGLVIPEQFPERLEAATDEAGPPLLDLIIAPSVTPQLRMLFALAVEGAVGSLRTEALLSSIGFTPGGDPWVESTAPLMRPAGIVENYAFQGQLSTTVPTAVQQSVPAWLVFAMFFVVIPLSTAFIIERQQGSLMRLRIMNISTFTLLTGKVVPYYLLNQAQMVLMLLVGMYLVPRLGGDALLPPSSVTGLFLISSATSFAAISFALLITTLARTHVQATTFGGVANIIFGAVGGIMVPKFVMPPFMQSLTVASPMSWGLEGFLDVFLRNGTWIDVLPEAAALTMFGTIAILLAAAVFARGR